MISRERLLQANKKARKRMKRWYFANISIEEYLKEIENNYYKYRKVTVFCSCECCGNPRKFDNLPTIQERKQNERYRQEKEYYL